MLAACRHEETPAPVALPPFESRPVIGLEAVFGEFRHLRSVLEGTPVGAVSTQGWDNLEQTEWPFFALIFYADAATRCASLPIAGSRRDAVVAEARWALERANVVGIKGAHPLLPHGHLLLALERFTREGRESEYGELRAHLANDLDRRFSASETGMLPSYPSIWWTLDPVPALAALTLRGVGAAARERWEATVRTSAIDPATGLVIAGWNPERGRAIGTPRGCALMLGLPDLYVVSPGLAQGQWSCARRHLVRTVQGVTGVREYPEPIDLPATTDSGRILFGVGEAASGFGLAAAAAAEDMVVLAALLRSARRVAPPTWHGDKLALPNVPPVGQAALLRAKVWNATAAAVAGRA
jgi:hypothetical protein